MASEFDVGSDTSPLFKFVAREFTSRGTPLRKRLATKEYGAEVASRLGLKSATKFGLLTSPGDFADLTLPHAFALKYAHGWSTRGIMLLHKSDKPDYYFEHLSQRLLHRDEIIESQLRVATSFPTKHDEWIVEELLTATTPGMVPFDYKFYTFREQVGLVIQIDRNTSPPKVALFDGEFNPLRPGVDYILTGTAQYGQHLLPKHPLQILRWASVLSLQTDAPFVSVDLFDTACGPAFGEYTFSPGGMHKRMWTLSREVIAFLDNLFLQNRPEDALPTWLSGRHETPLNAQSLASTSLPDLAAYEAIPDALYKRWSQYLYNGGRRGAVRMAEYYGDVAQASQNAAQFARALHDRWDSLPLLQLGMTAPV